MLRGQPRRRYVRSKYSGLNTSARGAPPGKENGENQHRQVQKQADEWFLAARMQFTENYQVAEARMRTLIAERKASQPLGLPSCGSVFKNPPGEHAARLIETAGLKEARVGGAQVSPKHANFIINTGGATAADIEALIRKVQSTVESRHGVRLETEVQIIGEPLAGRAGAEGV